MVVYGVYIYIYIYVQTILANPTYLPKKYHQLTNGLTARIVHQDYCQPNTCFKYIHTRIYRTIYAQDMYARTTTHPTSALHQDYC